LLTVDNNDKKQPISVCRCHRWRHSTASRQRIKLQQFSHFYCS